MVIKRELSAIMEPSMKSLFYAVLAISAIFFASFASAEGDSGLGIPPCEADRSCCKALGTGIDRICVRSDVPDLSGTRFESSSFFFDIKNDFQGMQFRTAGSDWKSPNLRDFQGHVAFFRSIGLVFRPFGKNANLNPQYQGYRYLANTPEFWSDGHGVMEKEVISDRHSFVNRMYVLNKGTTLTFRGVVPGSLLLNTTFVKDIDGKYCGTRNIIRVTSSTNELSSADYEIINTIHPCPTEYSYAGNGEWLVKFNDHPINTVREYTGLLTTAKVNGIDLGTEAGISDWIDSYDVKRTQLKEEYEAYMRSFAFPMGRTAEEKADYYRFLLSAWTGILCPVTDSPPPGLKDNFFVEGKPRCVTMPNVGQYTGVWVWDSALTMHGLLSAYDKDKASEFTTRVIRDTIEFWGYTQKKHPVVDDWDCEVHTSRTGPCPSQPAELYIPVALDAKEKGIISEDFMCSQMYPALMSHYYKYKALAGSDHLFSVGSSYGRDGTKIAPNSASTSAETGAVSGWGMMALGMATMAKRCGQDSEAFMDDHAAIKASFDTLWREDRSIYWNMEYGKYKDASTTNLGSTPYGLCMAILGGLVPKERIPMIFDALERNYVDGYSIYPGLGIGYTSVPTSASYYCPKGEGCGNGGGQWDGPVWDWVDNRACLDAIDIAIDTYGITELEPVRDKIVKREFNIIGRYSIFPMESYDSRTGDLARWSSRPYMAAGNPIPSIVNRYNIYRENLAYSMLSGICVEEDEACDGIDNDCDGEVDEGVTVACIDYGTCKEYQACEGRCMEAPAEVCDGKDNDCDTEVDEGVQKEMCIDYSDCHAYSACPGSCQDLPQESCDGRDNDCDGIVDEHVMRMCVDYATCKVYGTCLGECPAAPADVYDGIDNDCDGVKDEDSVRLCIDYGTCLVYPAHGVCPQKPLDIMSTC